MEAILVYITAGDEQEAARIARALLDGRLAACVNQLPGVASRFWWEGKLDSAQEVLLLAKTRRELWPRVLAAIRENHSYEVFEAIAVPILEGNPDYLRWIEETTSEPEP
jgi:periplasmic divalent cation tolerance protein